MQHVGSRPSRWHLWRELRVWSGLSQRSSQISSSDLGLDGLPNRTRKGWYKRLDGEEGRLKLEAEDALTVLTTDRLHVYRRTAWNISPSIGFEGPSRISHPVHVPGES